MLVPGIVLRLWYVFHLEYIVLFTAVGVWMMVEGSKWTWGDGWCFVIWLCGI